MNGNLHPIWFFLFAILMIAGVAYWGFYCPTRRLKEERDLVPYIEILGGNWHHGWWGRFALYDGWLVANWTKVLFEDLVRVEVDYGPMSTLRVRVVYTSENGLPVQKGTDTTMELEEAVSLVRVLKSKLEGIPIRISSKILDKAVTEG